MAEGNGNGGVIGKITQAASATLGKLPSEFLGLLLITAVFNLGMIWFFAKQGESRERVLAPLITACANSIPIEVLKYLPKQSDNH